MVSVNRDWVHGDYQAVLRVALNTAIDPATFQGKPRDLVLVVDTSGSMAEDGRLAYVKQGIDLLIEELGPNDRLGLVTYSSDAIVRSGLGESSAEELHAIVGGLSPSGSTNIYAGVSRGMEILAEGLSAERQSRLILLSDGNITSGPGPLDVIDMAEAFVGDGIGISSIGVGTDFNIDLMRGLSERGAGNFYFLESAAAIAEVFQEELQFASEAIARDLTVEVEGDPSHRMGEVLGTRLWQSGFDNTGSMSVPALFLSSRTSEDPGETGRRGGGSSLFIDMQPLEGSFEGETMATVRVSYRLPDSDELVTQEITVDNPIRGEIPAAGYVSHEEMLEAYAMYNAFLGLREGAQLAEYDYNCAAHSLEALEDSLAQWNERAEDPDLDADLVLVEQFLANLEARGAQGASCGEEIYYDDVYEEPMPCSIAQGREGAGSVLLLLLAIASMRRRPRLER
jgi:Ca-activated chloride channel family protein